MKYTLEALSVFLFWEELKPGLEYGEEINSFASFIDDSDFWIVFSGYQNITSWD